MVDFYIHYKYIYTENKNPDMVESCICLEEARKMFLGTKIISDPQLTPQASLEMSSYWIPSTRRPFKGPESMIIVAENFFSLIDSKMPSFPL